MEQKKRAYASPQMVSEPLKVGVFGSYSIFSPIGKDGKLTKKCR